MKDVYQRLAEFLDTLPQRYPVNTESGIEIKILKHIFTPDEAEFFMKLKARPETAADVAARLGGNPEEMEQKLYEMSKKGLILRTGKQGMYKYMVIAFLAGFAEFQVNRMTPELARDMEAFEPILFNSTWMKGNTRDLRVIPIAEAVDSETQVMPYESVEKSIKSAKHIAVSDCFCRKMKEFQGKPCSHPVEVCFHFGSDTHYFVENGLGRYISQEQAMAILKKGKEAGLVCQVSASQAPMALCMCCDCCCGSLRVTKQNAKPSEMLNSNFFARVTADDCTGCEVCLERCPMDAITVNEVAVVNLDRCIGCGACAYACPAEAVRVYRKAKDKEFIPEKDFVSALQNMYRERRNM